MKTKMLAAALLLGTANFAAAADAVVEEAVVVEPGFTWTGGYVGGQVGYAWGSSTADYTSLTGSSDMDPDGWLGGVYIGYNHQMPSNVVLGIEADVVYSDVDGRGQYVSDLGPEPGSFDSVDLNWSGAVRGRIGYAVDRFLPYFAAGVAFGGVDTISEDTNPAFAGSWNDTYVGYTVGVGAEYAATDNLILRVEYRYTDFGSETFTAIDVDSVHDVDLSTSDVRFGVAWKF